MMAIWYLLIVALAWLIVSFTLEAFFEHRKEKRAIKELSENEEHLPKKISGRPLPSKTLRYLRRVELKCQSRLSTIADWQSLQQGDLLSVQIYDNEGNQVEDFHAIFLQFQYDSMGLINLLGPNGPLMMYYALDSKHFNAALIQGIDETK